MLYTMSPAGMTWRTLKEAAATGREARTRRHCQRVRADTCQLGIHSLVKLTRLDG